MELGAVDIVVVIALVYSMYHGFTKGLIISLASLVGLVLGVWGAVKFSGITASYLNDHWQIQIPLLAFALTFCLILFGTYFLGKLIEKVVDILALGFLNKIGGVLFNGIKMSLILTVIFMLVTQVNDKYQLFEANRLSAAYSYPYLKALSDQLLPFVKQVF